MLYVTKMTMALDLVIGEVARQRPEIHCPIEYMEWLYSSIRYMYLYTLARANLKKATKWPKSGYGKARCTVKLQCGG